MEEGLLHDRVFETYYNATIPFYKVQSENVSCYKWMKFTFSLYFSKESIIIRPSWLKVKNNQDEHERNSVECSIE